MSNPSSPASLPVLVGVCGGSGSGKTTLAHALVARRPGTSLLLSFDNYYCDQGHLTPHERGQVNYDHPDSLDVAQFAQDLAKLSQGETVHIPMYDFATHTRMTETQRIEPLDLIVVDGILLLAFADIRATLDLAVFVDASDGLRTERRVVRDIEQRGRTRDFALGQIARTVRPMFDQFVAPSRTHADLVIDGTVSPQSSADQVLAAVDALQQV